MGRLNKLYEKFHDRGLRIVVISPQDPKTLREGFVKDLGAKYWIGSDSRARTLMNFVEVNQVAKFPQQYLVDATGTVVDPGADLDATIDLLLRDVFDEDLGRGLRPELKRARGYYEKGAIGKAFVEAGKHLEAEDRAVVADAEFLRAKCEAFAVYRKWRVEKRVRISRGMRNTS